MRREAAWEYVRGALWVLPTLAVFAALAAGSILSQIDMSAESPSCSRAPQTTPAHC